MKKVLLGELYRMIQELTTELNDSIEFMETLEDFEDAEGKKRREDKMKLVELSEIQLKTLKEDLTEQLNNGEDDNSYRVCSECEDIMNQGYCIEDGLNYYCSDTCLEKNMTREEYLELYNDGDGDSYWTQWEG